MHACQAAAVSIRASKRVYVLLERGEGFGRPSTIVCISTSRSLSWQYHFAVVGWLLPEYPLRQDEKHDVLKKIPIYIPSLHARFLGAARDASGWVGGFVVFIYIHLRQIF